MKRTIAFPTFRPSAAAAALLLLGAPAVAGAQAVPEARSGPDGSEAAIARLIEETEAANNAGDVERWVALFADGAVYMPPGSPPVTTREGLIDMARAGFRNRAAIDIEPLEIEVFGDRAFARSRVTGTVTVQDTGEEIAVDSKQIVIYAREADGRWRIARMIMNGNGR